MSARIVMNSDAIERSIERLAMEILERNQGVENLAIIGIHTGGVFMATRLHEKITAHEDNEVPTASLDITLYRDDWSLISQNPIVRKTSIEFSVEDKNVVLVDDVIFTGRTIRAAMDAIMDYGRPRSIQLAVLVDRQGRELPIQPDYTGVCIRADGSERVDVLLSEDRKGDEVVIDNK
ncbi:bifunctional pyr operon transcriptional regulator/uracil phosphoribosyltransferase PyrR [Desulfobulbus sp. US1]|nr:bifunctional pyr operon transcriptional regulator/uracil phosphoribosyltransferase PyrR [Desulfobulbus sp. US4]MCW5204644.1 bifunctional pyr operon transcriptional regulator/uracil phosphoribosyltransferase PyrR [Desulfobulbus sp. N2]MCW5208620.1 bifunctional pyr operon transcriptional regulator/uracil phosphoribosyltransferase PyrR [Desulfobulbus sp. US1]MCW5214407.1 bifunctional pyr operon transcriptional regulator/uracil phosphoribosyltransferase PyrR [Desulfobulbus sp. US5]WLE95902.1 MAG